MKIRPVGAELCAGGKTDRRADMTKLRVAFRNFTKATKNYHILNSYKYEESGEGNDLVRETGM